MHRFNAEIGALCVKITPNVVLGIGVDLLGGVNMWYVEELEIGPRGGRGDRSMPNTWKCYLFIKILKMFFLFVSFNRKNRGLLRRISTNEICFCLKLCKLCTYLCRL